MEPHIVREKLAKEDIVTVCAATFGTMVKIDVDVARGILTIGGEWHSEGAALLVADGSDHEQVWGANYYPWNPPEKRIEYVSLINIKPSLDHKRMEVTDPQIKEQMKVIAEKLLLAADETVE